MLNKEVYVKNPADRMLVNEGVAYVNDDKNDQVSQSVLRYELETFVCDGQYKEGLKHVLETYRSNLNNSAKQQPSVWVSGFYGSGKSHLVKMLRSLWVNTHFSDGATARSIANLPIEIKDLLKEIDVLAKQHGVLHAASGTLGSGAHGSVRLALLNIIFKSVDLPQEYSVAKFVMWLKKEKIFDAVKQHVEANGCNWIEELDNFYVAEGLHNAIIAAKPQLFASVQSCVDAMNNLYPRLNDISSKQMITAIEEALTKDGKFPLTLVILDEVQQYIGADSDRSIAVQEMVEAVTKEIGVKMMFIGTGQTAVTGTPNLARLQGRFTVRIELSDTDVDTVIRQVLLAKTANAKDTILKKMENNIGEISRHLQGTSIGHTHDDCAYFVQDYPILPVRRRFWENTLRVMDQTGTDSQLRNQLSMVHKVIKDNAEQQVGHVVPADFLYFDSAERLLQARVLPKTVYESTMRWLNGNEDEKLTARSCGLVFLINKLASKNKVTGIKATANALADLLIEDLEQGSSTLRSKLPELLNKCELLIKVGDEYRIQTEESTAWNADFENQKSILSNNLHQIDQERDKRFKDRFLSKFNKRQINQGLLNVTRDILPIFDINLPLDANSKLYVWVRVGKSGDENSIKADAQQSGNSSPTIYVFIPRRSIDALRHNLINLKAAASTIATRGTPNTPEGREAYDAMVTIRSFAETKINELLDEDFSGARIYQGGGNEITGNNLEEMIMEAAKNSLSRMYPSFNMADHQGWPTVYTKASKGEPDSLKAVGYDGDIAQNQVCRSVLTFVGMMKTGLEVKNNFLNSPYGWAQDCVDGALLALCNSGLVRVSNENDLPIAIRDIERRQIGKYRFRLESINITALQRIQIRKLFQELEINCPASQEHIYSKEFVDILLKLAKAAGGENPLPELPNISLVEEIRLTPAGNEQLLAIVNSREELEKYIKEWKDIGAKIKKRLPDWELLNKLLHGAQNLPNANIFSAQINVIKQKRQLLDDPNPLTPLITDITQVLRDELNQLKNKWDHEWNSGDEVLKADENWNKLEPEQKHKLRQPYGLILSDCPEIDVTDAQTILQTLKMSSLIALNDRIAAMPDRFRQILFDAAKLLEPKAQTIQLPRRTLKSIEDIDSWLADVKEQLAKAVNNGPVVIS